MKKMSITIVALFLISTVAMAIGATTRTLEFDTWTTLTSNGNLTLTPNGTGIVATDNLGLDGNTISSTDTNGNITLDPDGTGSISLNANTTTNQLDILTQGDLRLQDTTGGEYIGFQAPSTVTSSQLFTLPDGDGSNGQALVTDGAGTLSWGASGGGGAYVNYAQVNLTNYDVETGDTTDWSVSWASVPGIFGASVASNRSGDYGISFDADAATDQVVFDSGTALLGPNEAGSEKYLAR